MYNLETKLQKQFAKDHDKNFIVPNNCVVICPWIIRNGFQNVAENGYLDKSADPRYYGFFQKIFTGNESITATWEDSTYLTKLEDEYKFKYNFQTGKYYFGVPVIGSATGGTSIENVESNEDYLGMKEEGTVTIRVEGWVPTRADKYKLYTIPDLYGAQWFYISEVKYLNDLQWAEGVDSTNIPVVEVTFTTLVDKLQNSGKAVEQYVQYAAPGEPYVVPIVFNRDLNEPQPNQEGQWVEPYKEVSFAPYQAVSTNYLQIELQGSNAISGVQIVGRTLTRNENGEYISSPWKFLLPYRMIANQVNEINRTSLPSRNFYWFPEGSLDFVTSKTYQQSIKERDDALSMNQSAGKLEMGIKSDWTNLATGLHKSNPIIDELHFDYNNTAWLPHSYFWTTINHDTSGCYYCVDNLKYDGNETMLELLTKNGFIFSTQPILPLGFKSSKPYHISTIPIIGGIIAKFFGDFSINPNTTQRKPLSFGYFVDCDVAGMLVNIFDQDTLQSSANVYCPIDALVGDETKASKYLGTTALNTTISFELTDQVLDTTFPEGGKNLDTIYFGQTKDENGEFILPTQLPYLYGSTGQSATKKDLNSILVIDEISIYALHKGKIKVSGYYDPNTPTWTTTINSKANWTDSIRDWATTISTGGWSQEWCDWTAANWPWPERPGKTINPIVDLPFSPAYEIISNLDDPIEIVNEGRYKNNFVNAQKINNSIIKCKQQEYSTSKIWNYSDLNIAGVVDKESFKEYFKSVKLPLTSNLKWIVEQSQQREVEYNGEEYIELNESDEYELNIPLCGFGWQNGIIPKKIIDDETTRNVVAQRYWSKNIGQYSRTGGCVSTIIINLKLYDNSFEISLRYWVDFQTNRSDYFKDWTTNTGLQLNWEWSGGQTSEQFSLVDKISYSHKQQIVEFVPKGVTPTGYYLAGGSKVLGGFRYNAGQDENVWYLYDADGEVVTPDTFGLQYVTLPPGLGNATWEQVGDNGLRVKWTAAQERMDFEIYVVAQVGAEEIKEKIHIIIV